MRRADGYLGKKPRGGGLTAGQVCAVFLAVLVVLLAMTTRAASQWSGQPAHQVLYEAVFETEDWS